MKNHRSLPVIFVVVILLVVGLLLVKGKDILPETASKKIADLYEYYGISKDEEGDGQAVILLNGQVDQETRAYVSEGTYLPLDYVKANINERFYYDTNEGLLLYTMPSETESYTLDDKNIKSIDGQIYLSTDFILKYSNVTFKDYDSPKRLVVTTAFDRSIFVASLSEDSNLRLEGDKKSDIMKNCKKGEKVEVLKEGKKWTKVLTEDGLTGYLSCQSLGKTKEETRTNDYTAPVYSGLSMGKTVSLAWHQVTNMTSNGSLSEVLAEMEGVNVISPTWLSVESSNGKISSIASSDYVTLAHNHDLQVWALLNDFTTDSDGKHIINDLLPYTSKRSRLIKNVIAELEAYEIDGLNLDFEYIASENGDHFIQFVRELSLACHKSGIILSIDNYVSSAWTAYYNRAEQGVFADYVVIMGYDEHNTSSTEAGSVASLSFERAGIINTIAEVGNPSKIISGMPFYTRIWFETDGSTGSSEDGKFIEDAANGDYYLSSQAVGMEVAENYFSKNNIDAEKIWVEDAGQYYAEGQLDEDTLVRIWYENEKSIEAKLQLIGEYKLAGGAFWKLGFEKDSIWELVSKYLS